MTRPAERKIKINYAGVMLERQREESGEGASSVMWGPVLQKILKILHASE